MLKHAEDHLGIKLFERLGGRLHPTPEALALLPQTDRVFDLVDSLKRVAKDLSAGRLGQLSIASSPGLVNALLPRALAEFRKTRSFLRVSISSLISSQVVERVIQREVDFGIVYAHGANPTLRQTTLASIELACVLRKDHRLASKKSISIDDLGRELIISYGSQTILGRRIDEELRMIDAPPLPTTIQVDSGITACLMANHSGGVAVIEPSVIGTRAFSDLVVRRLLPKVPVEIELISAPDRPQSRLAMAFAEHLKESTPKLVRVLATT
jgi:DNA-binding transcriptional LysR family regulator